MFSKSLTKHFKGFSGRYTELRAKLDVEMLLDFAIQYRKSEIQSQKSAQPSPNLRGTPANPLHCRNMPHHTSSKLLS
jgi:hypothetical protein